MTALSKLYNKCGNCKYKNICDDKRMVACSLAEIQKVNTGQCITRKEILKDFHGNEVCEI